MAKVQEGSAPMSAMAFADRLYLPPPGLQDDPYREDIEHFLGRIDRWAAMAYSVFAPDFDATKPFSPDELSKTLANVAASLKHIEGLGPDREHEVGLAESAAYDVLAIYPDFSMAITSMNFGIEKSLAAWVALVSTLSMEMAIAGRALEQALGPEKVLRSELTGQKFLNELKRGFQRERSAQGGDGHAAQADKWRSIAERLIVELRSADRNCSQVSLISAVQAAVEPLGLSREGNPWRPQDTTIKTLIKVIGDKNWDLKSDPERLRSKSKPAL